MYQKRKINFTGTQLRHYCYISSQIREFSDRFEIVLSVSKFLQIIFIAQQSLSNIKLKENKRFQTLGKENIERRHNIHHCRPYNSPAVCISRRCLAHPLEATRKEGLVHSSPTDIQTQRPHTENQKHNAK